MIIILLWSVYAFHRQPYIFLLCSSLICIRRTIVMGSPTYFKFCLKCNLKMQRNAMRQIDWSNLLLIWISMCSFFFWIPCDVIDQDRHLTIELIHNMITLLCRNILLLFNSCSIALPAIQVFGRISFFHKKKILQQKLNKLSRTI